MGEIVDQSLSQVLAGLMKREVRLKLSSGEKVEGEINEVGEDYCSIWNGQRSVVYNIRCITTVEYD